MVYCNVTEWLLPENHPAAPLKLMLLGTGSLSSQAPGGSQDDTRDNPHQSPMKSPHSFCLMEMFKIQDGKIRHAEAVFITVPYRMPSPWAEHPE